MKKKFFIILIALISCFTFSVLAETLIFNFRPLFSDDNQSSIDVSFDATTDKKQTILNLNLDSTYVNKLVIDYNTTEDVKYTLEFSQSGLYGIDEQIKIDDIFDNSLNASILNIDQTVSQATITYENNDNLSVSSISINNGFYFNIYRTIFNFLVLAVIFFLIYFYKTGFSTKKLHVYFATLCILLGSMFIIAQPTASFYSWDDQIHFDNTVGWFGGANHYNNGEFHSSDANVSDSAGKDVIDSADERQLQESFLNSNIESNYIKTTVSFPSIDKPGYFPMALGYHLAKLVHLPFTVCFIIGKLTNLIVYALLIAYAIKISLVGKRLIAVIALIPTSIFLASSYSYDPAVFTGITIFTVHLINLFVDKKSKLDFKTALIMIASITYACLTKAVYAPIILLTLLIPKTRFSSLKQSRLTKIGFAIISLLLLSVSVLPMLEGNDLSDQRGGDVSASQQAELIVEHPTDYLTVVNNTTIKYFFKKLIGPPTVTSFGYIDTNNNDNDLSNSNAYFIFIILIFFVFFTDNKNNLLTKKQRGYGTFISLIIIALIWGALYLSYTPVGSSIVNGTQGRYFLPLILPLLFFLQPKNIQNKINSKTYNTLTLAIPSLIIIFLVYSMILVPYSL